MIQREIQGMVFLQDADFDPHEITFHGFFGRWGGVSAPPFDTLNIGWNCGDAPEAVQENLARIASVFHIPVTAIFRSRQVHGSQVVSVQPFAPPERHLAPTEWPEADALLTDQAGIALALSTADCLPVLLFDPARPAVGAVHAGWRGSVKRISAEAIRRMNLDYGTDPANLLVLMGPSVGPCCYPIGSEVARLASVAAPGAQSFLWARPEGGWTLDLRKLNETQILSCGVPKENILHVDLCTACRPDLFFSVRRDGNPTGRQLALIGLTGPTARRTGLKETHPIADEKRECPNKPRA